MSNDERMDRAERIRQMREGNREATDGDDAAVAADQDTDGTATDPDDDAASTPADGDAGSSADAASAASEAEPTPETDTEVLDGTDTAASEDDAPDSAQAAAVAAAERAAKSATAVTGTDSEVPEAATAAETDGVPPADAPDAGSAGEASAGGPTLQGPTGVALPDQQLLDQAMTAAGGDSGHRQAATAVEEQATQAEELVRALEFALGEEYYCLDIEYVEEIVKHEAVTRVPNTPAFVDGVVDLRGQITTILDPKEMMDIDATGAERLIVVFDPEMFEEQGAVGWLVDEVRQVAPVYEDEVNTPPTGAAYINGVVDHGDTEQFLIWVDPDAALQAASAESDD